MIEVAASREPGAAPVDLEGLVAVVRATAARLGVGRASVGLMVVPPARMRALNAAHRGVDRPTDVLSFPVDGPELAADPGAWPEDGPPPELGDVVVCPEAAEDAPPVLCVHGVLHLLGHDHEADAGEMLALQDRLVAELCGPGGVPPPARP